MEFDAPFLLIDDYLTRYQPLFKYRPFRSVSQGAHGNVSSPGNFSSLFGVLNGIDNNLLESFENDLDHFVEFLSSKAPELQTEYQRICHFEEQLYDSSPAFGESGAEIDRFFKTGIPGRKWEQIKRFNSYVHAKRPVLDWCSGKGHLARLIALKNDVAVDCLEFDKALCDKGVTLSEKACLPIQFHCHDVFTPLPNSLKTSDCHYTALHACGNLHLEVMKNAVANQVMELSVSPCCYHKIPDNSYLPVSSVGKSSSLQLTRDDLALCVAEMVTGGNRSKRLRIQERLWRLAFDILQREMRQCDEYMPIPSIPKALLSGSFQEFCAWCCNKKELSFPFTDKNTTAALLQQAEDLLWTIRKYELIHQLFKRPIELWLNLDRCLYLQENGFEVDLRIFCDKSLTPRNLFIQAHR
jgi:hypothetical protein